MTTPAQPYILHHDPTDPTPANAFRRMKDGLKVLGCKVGLRVAGWPVAVFRGSRYEIPAWPAIPREVLDTCVGYIQPVDADGRVVRDWSMTGVRLVMREALTDAEYRTLYCGTFKGNNRP